MQQRTLSTVHVELEAFLVANVGRVRDGDVGPWLGEAAELVERGAADDVLPAHWHDAVNAALAPDATNATVPGPAPRTTWTKRTSMTRALRGRGAAVQAAR
jgi:hypothetical protein